MIDCKRLLSKKISEAYNNSSGVNENQYSSNDLTHYTQNSPSNARGA